MAHHLVCAAHLHAAPTVVVLDGNVDPLGGAAFVVAEVFGEAVSDQTLALSRGVAAADAGDRLLRHEYDRSARHRRPRRILVGLGGDPHLGCAGAGSRDTSAAAGGISPFYTALSTWKSNG